MKIQASNTSPLPATSGAEPGIARAAIAAQSAPPGDDQVRLSRLSDTVMADTGDGQRTANIVQITGQVNAGNYRVPAAVVSADIIRHSLRAAAAA